MQVIKDLLPSAKPQKKKKKNLHFPSRVVVRERRDGKSWDQLPGNGRE